MMIERSLLSLLLLSAAGTADPAETKDSPATKIRWTAEEGKAVRFHLEYENSRKIEALSKKGLPLDSGAELDLPRRISIEVHWKWARVQKTQATAIITIERIQAADLPGWKDKGSTPRNLKLPAKLATDNGKRIEFRWRGRQRTKLLNFTKDRALATDLRKLMEEALEDLWRYIPGSSAPSPPGPGASWGFDRAFSIQPGLELHTTVELEYLSGLEKLEKQSEEPESGPPPAISGQGVLARIEGAIGQSLSPPPAGWKHTPGAFPGKVYWIHDLEVGFPVQLEAEKITRIPVPNKTLPTMNTLTHTYRIRVRLLRTSPRGVEPAR